ncbi:RNA polymerase sigma factor [Fibrella forsythiae]|uniref:Sigma-70 family RNA polymerase sigma factor n=1 Tax=Fibrella forsythiae TaxID=2817061 RepID=A0ABS3JP18_9BACT|nr:sigma-70 family RNA polymerase sigma factor [Fibrella forsythiae]MBO0951735.1 sigma-70 family RNA polymerase sigma factor [Fibrella forsythiae]
MSTDKLNTNVDDCQLWNDFRAGDRVAFAQLYERYVTVLYNYGFHMVTDSDLVEDAIQELFIDLWRLRTTLSPTTSVKFYLYRAMRRRIRVSIDAQQHMVPVNDMFATAALPLTPPCEAEYILQEQQELDLQRLHQVLPQLPPRQYEVIRLRFFDNFSWDEIAAIMQMNEQSVRNLVQRAIRKLRELFGILFMIALWAILS